MPKFKEMKGSGVHDGRMLSESERAYERMLDATVFTPFSPNEHGVWCPECGNDIARPWFFEDEDYRLPSSCKECGFPND